MKHKVKKLDNIPWEMGPKFDAKNTLKLESTTPVKPKRTECYTLPPIEIHYVLEEAQANNIELPDSVLNWMVKESQFS